MSTLKVNTIQDTSGVTRPSGILVADHWIITSGYNTNGTVTMSYNWARASSTIDGHGDIGSAMTQSSGVFTFPSTGIYLVGMQQYFVTSGGRTYVGVLQQLSTDSGSNWTTRLSGYGNGYQNNAYIMHQSFNVYDITNTSTHKIRFRTEVSDTVFLSGSSTNKQTGAIFIRLGDT